MPGARATMAWCMLPELCYSWRLTPSPFEQLRSSAGMLLYPKWGSGALSHQQLHRKVLDRELGFCGILESIEQRAARARSHGARGLHHRGERRPQELALGDAVETHHRNLPRHVDGMPHHGVHEPERHG